MGVRQGCIILSCLFVFMNGAVREMKTRMGECGREQKHAGAQVTCHTYCTSTLRLPHMYIDAEVTRARERLGEIQYRLLWSSFQEVIVRGDALKSTVFLFSI